MVFEWKGQIAAASGVVVEEDKNDGEKEKGIEKRGGFFFLN